MWKGFSTVGVTSVASAWTPGSPASNMSRSLQFPSFQASQMPHRTTPLSKAPGSRLQLFGLCVCSVAASYEAREVACS